MDELEFEAQYADDLQVLEDIEGIEWCIIFYFILNFRTYGTICVYKKATVTFLTRVYFRIKTFG